MKCRNKKLIVILTREQLGDVDWLPADVKLIGKLQEQL